MAVSVVAILVESQIPSTRNLYAIHASRLLNALDLPFSPYERSRRSGFAPPKRHVFYCSRLVGNFLPVSEATAVLIPETELAKLVGGNRTT